MTLTNTYFQFFNVDSMEQLEQVIKQAYESLQPVTLTLVANH